MPFKLASSSRFAWRRAMLALVLAAPPLLAEESVKAPRPTPVTRPEMKRLLEDMKNRTPRIPLPELSAEDKVKAEADPRNFGYEARLRKLYIPNSDARGYLPFAGMPKGGYPGTGRTPAEQDPVLSLDYPFKTRLFWIASRANNCQYCLGHQESKLLATGMLEDQLAALDTDWSTFPVAEQAAFALARRLTLEPHKLTDADIDACRKYYTDLQIIEMAASVAGNNAINRWKEGTGVPQSGNGGNFGGASPAEAHSYLTATSETFSKKPSLVAPLASESKPTDLTVQTGSSRGPRKPLAETLADVSNAAHRKARLPIASEEETRKVLGDLVPSDRVPNWMRLLAQFPFAGKQTVTALRSAETTSDLSPALRGAISWVIARQDNSIYALGDARRQLEVAGKTDQDLADLDGDRKQLTDAERALLVVAEKLAASPVVLTDEEVSKAVELAGPRDVVQTIHYTCLRAAFGRYTEVAALPVE